MEKRRTVYENQIIDWFLGHLAAGTRPHTAAMRAGATLKLLTKWATEDHDEARIFAEQWETAAHIGHDMIEEKLRELAFIGEKRYVVTKEGVATEYNPATKRNEPMFEMKISEMALKLLAQHKLADFSPHLGRSSENTSSASGITDVVAAIDPDEHGPAEPIL